MPQRNPCSRHHLRWSRFSNASIVPHQDLEPFWLNCKYKSKERMYCSRDGTEGIDLSFLLGLLCVFLVLVDVLSFVVVFLFLDRRLLWLLLLLLLLLL